VSPVRNPSSHVLICFVICRREVPQEITSSQGHSGWATGDVPTDAAAIYLLKPSRQTVYTWCETPWKPLIVVVFPPPSELRFIFFKHLTWHIYALAKVKWIVAAFAESNLPTPLHFLAPSADYHKQWQLTTWDDSSLFSAWVSSSYAKFV